jgi:2'-5' RNA ligase
VLGDERIRLFCALVLPEDALAEVVAWQAEHLSGGRIVPSGNLHVTLAFLGGRPSSELPAILAELRAASAAAEPCELRPVRYHETRSVGMIVLDDVSGAATALAEDVQRRLDGLGVFRREARKWLPHVTVLRLKKPEGVRSGVENIRSINVVRSALYRSTLAPGGARYDALETAALGGGSAPSSNS